MKKINFLLALILTMGFNVIQAQDNDEIKKESKFSFIMQAGTGHGILENKNEANYNLDNNCGEILFNYTFRSGFGFATGAGYAELSGNAFNSIGHFYQERQLLRIPVLVTIKHKLTQRTKLLFDVGVYGQNILKDQFTYADQVQKDVFGGWNFGFQIGAGFIFEIIEDISFGLTFKSQASLSAMKTSHDATLSDEQKFKTINSIGILIIREF